MACVWRTFEYLPKRLIDRVVGPERTGERDEHIQRLATRIEILDREAANEAMKRGQHGHMGD